MAWFHLACLGLAAVRARGDFRGPRVAAGPVRTPDHPVSFHIREDAAKSRMLYLGATRSPSYLAELRALGLAAAACDLFANKRL